MESYATWTGTRRNLDAMQAHGWRVLMTPDTLDRNGGRSPVWTDGAPALYALDNGAWGCHQQGIAWDADRFLRWVDAVGDGADWIVLPDIVGGGLPSLDLSLSWLDRLPGRVLLPVQDGLGADDVLPHVGGRVGIFVGGSTAWKLATLPLWGRVARQAGAWLHVGRVNTCRRICLCGVAPAHSFDGTSVTRFGVTVHKLDAARRAYTLCHWRHPWDL